MDYDFQQTPFSKAMLTGLFAGIIATLLALFYNIIFRDSTHFPLASLINVSSLIFAVNLIFLVVGIVYYLFIKTFSRGDLIYMIVFVLLIAFCIWQTEGVHRSADQVLNIEFRHLLLGIVIIMGIGALMVPYLFHNKGFQKHVI